MNIIEEINAIEYLFLDEMKEPDDNCLALRIFEGIVGEPEDTDFGGVVLKNTRPITIEAQSRSYGIYFKMYVAYSIRNESYTTWDEEEEWVGRIFRTYSKSKFIDYVSKSTFANDEFPGPLTHYGIVCQNHVIDVVSTVEPQIERLF